MRSIYRQFRRNFGDENRAGIFNIVNRQVMESGSMLLVFASLATTNAYAGSATPRIKQLETNLTHSCVLFKTGEVSCWGEGQGLGNGSLDNSSSPLPVVGINDPNSRLTGVKALATGGTIGFSCALMRNREVSCWGVNNLGQLGNITTTEATEAGQAVSTTPVMVRDISGSGYLNGVKQLVVGINHSCALLKDRRVACWGANNLGQLGSDEANEMSLIGSFSYSTVPLLVKDTSGSGVLEGVRELSNAGLHTCGLLRRGEVVCWGANFSDQLGAPTENFFSSTPVIAHPDDPALKRVKQVTTHLSASCVLSVNGKVSCWGGNNFGTLGDGTTDSSLTPVAVKPIGGGEGRLRGVKRITGGAAACAELRHGKVACWGFNRNGNLADGTTDDSSVPVRPLGIGGIGKLNNVKQIKPSSHSCALQKRNQVLCWGANASGELGDGTNESSLFPVRVIDLH